MGYFLIGTVWCIVWGVVVNKVIENKGYKENWFWWGFFFGVFALIVAITKQNVPLPNDLTISEQPAKTETTPEKRIDSTKFDKIDINSAIHITECNIRKDNETDGAILIDFFNLSNKTITAVLFSAVGENSFGDLVLVDGEESFEILSQDIYTGPGKHCHIKASLPNQNIRKVQLRVKKVCFSDGEIVLAQPNRWIETRQQAIDPRYADCVRQKNPKGAYHAIIEDNYWQCTCGFVNIGHTCLACGTGKFAASEFTAEKIEETYQRYLTAVEAEKKAKEEKAKELAEQEEKQRKQAEKSRKKVTLTAILSLAIIVFLILLPTVIIPNGKYNDAVKLMNDGKYDIAIQAFESLDGYRDSATQIKECKYLSAIEAQRNKDYEAAYTQFSELKQYADSSTKAVLCAVEAAESEMTQKQYDKAASWYEAAGKLSEANNAKYQYVLANKNNTDTLTFTYLSELKQISYEDASSIYDQLYEIHFEYVINDSKTDFTTQKTRFKFVSSYDGGAVFIHVKITGGYPGQKVYVAVDGSSHDFAYVECNSGWFTLADDMLLIWGAKSTDTTITITVNTTPKIIEECTITVYK